MVALPTVLHLVSTVRGRLRPDVGLAALLEATFPGGSITGAPKRRAMQIIDELEPAARGPYTGATGWLGAAGDLDLAIAIRTALVRGGRLSLSVGGGIVADSTPEGELAETEVKARAFAALLRRARLQRRVRRSLTLAARVASLVFGGAAHDARDIPHLGRRRPDRRVARVGGGRAAAMA